MLVTALALSFSGCSFFDWFNNDGTEPKPEPEMYISQTSVTLKVGGSVLLQATASDDSEIIWISSDESVATVTDGLVNAVGEGVSLVTAASDSAMASCTVTVGPADPTDNPGGDNPGGDNPGGDNPGGDNPGGDNPGGDNPNPGPGTGGDVVTISKTALTLNVGESERLIAVSSFNSSVSWSSSDSTVATVAGGVVTAVHSGEAVITAKTATASAQCVVTVIFPGAGEDGAKEGYKLVWRDEFDGTALDTTKWGYQLGVQDQYGSSTGPVFWGNDELQYYTREAVSVSNGMLAITATKQAMGDGRSYSSGRILTRDLGYWTYGYFEARMKTPTGNGMWPAFWMLPQPTNASSSDNIYGGWPANGEIDIMEAKGRLANKVDTTLHFGKAWNAHDYVSKETTLSSNTDEWHTYAVDWTDSEISWYVDEVKVLTVTKYRWWSQDSSNQGQSMPFDKPFYMLINLAVGGQYDGYTQPDESFTSATMYVDYVRVYEKNN
ncbi:MAG: family 16 glycosylhydrolase [Clostridiales bacterium]|nr:family 16 glycosylhydrolase [Clostridiales bacterium]